MVSLPAQPNELCMGDLTREILGPPAIGPQLDRECPHVFWRDGEWRRRRQGVAAAELLRDTLPVQHLARPLVDVLPDREREIAVGRRMRAPSRRPLGRRRDPAMRELGLGGLQRHSS